jgi:hypothetical protein
MRGENILGTLLYAVLPSLHSSSLPWLMRLGKVGTLGNTASVRRGTAVGSASCAKGSWKQKYQSNMQHYALRHPTGYSGHLLLNAEELAVPCYRLCTRVN